MVEFIIVMECEEDDTTNYLDEQGWVGDISCAQRFMDLAAARTEAWAAAEDADNDWYIAIEKIDLGTGERTLEETIKEAS